MNASRREMAATLGAFVLAMVAVLVLGFHDCLTGDTIHYRAMIRGEAAPAPYAYRVLTPAIVGFLPLPSSDGFLLVAFTATLGTLLIMRSLFLDLGVSRAAATVTAVFLCFSYPVANYLVHWERIDPLANFAFALSLLLILRRRFVPATLVMAAGVLAKETLLFLLPILLWHRIRGDLWNPRAYARAALLCAPPILVWLGVRAAVEIDPDSFVVEEPEDLALVLQSAWEYNVEQFGLAKRLFRELTKSYGWFWALAAAGLLIDRRLRLESLYLVAVGFLLCGFATDWARMLGTGFPGVFIPAAFFVDRLRRGSAWRPLLAGFLVLGAAQSYLSFLIFRDLDRSGQLAMAAAVLLVSLAGAGLAVWGYLDSRPSAGGTNHRPPGRPA